MHRHSIMLMIRPTFIFPMETTQRAGKKKYLLLTNEDTGGIDLVLVLVTMDIGFNEPGASIFSKPV